MGIEHLSPNTSTLLSYLITHGPISSQTAADHLQFDQASLDEALNEIRTTDYRLCHEAQTDGEHLLWVDNAVEVSPASYLIQDAPKTRCPLCDKTVQMLIPKETSRQPSFYICWPCCSIFQIAHGPVPLDKQPASKV